MAIFGYSDIFLFILAIIFLCVWRSKSWRKSSVPTNWPLVGMLPAVLQNCHRIHAYVTELLSECGGTFEFKGPWFCNMDMLITSDPANIHHIFSRNFSNYPKGPEFRKIFEILGDGIFNADFELWELHRRTTLSFMSHVKFYDLLERAVWEKVETGLLPVLEHFLKQGIDADLQDIFQRFTFDSICKLVLDCDPCSLCIDLPYIPCEKAFNEALEALLHRHVLPESIWKLQKWLQIGKEKKLMEAWKAFDEFIYPRITFKDDFSLLTAFRKAYEEMNGSSSDARYFLRDTALSLMLAGRDTTSTCLTWLFWLIAKNPSTKIKIREEIENELPLKDDKKWRFFNVEESRRLVYLHGALCEALRLFPPVALEHKSPVKPDILPSGNYLQLNTKIIVSFYSTGRMERVWGKDCLKFMPERWISPCGGIKHEPSYKFPAFNAGPRTCLGKEMAFIQMKMVAATIVYHYNIELVDDHPVSPRDSVILQAKHGLRVRLSKRNV
ncbi:Cytochrome P450 CYP4/CYP19/CYP26 subfamily [Handroanthus impetiginosus]|uniref:Cytochrome P450 CYP4/CYP19/CYP26 subfamily n=1 Tax=Handroanthus impetiginosus TaxID=429701 RepID=A0A2G9G4Y5_9LAMI|nr:Cytochrome P450 CYP4/CYP19/CYP26 subfamily [Handroanthus impetiginosus]